MSRFDVMVMLFLGVMAAFGTVGLVNWGIGRLVKRGVVVGPRGWLPGALCFGGGTDYVRIPCNALPDQPAGHTARYEQLAADPSNQAVLNLPANYERPWYLLYQITHGKPLATGYVTRDDPNVLRERAPVLSQFWFLGPDIHTQGFDPRKQGMQVLHDQLGVGWVVLDRYKMPGGPEREITTDYAQQIFADRRRSMRMTA